MGGGGTGTGGEPPDLLTRNTLCFSQPQPEVVLHEGDQGFREGLRQLYSVAESNAAEKLVKLKEQLREADVERFWELLTEGMTEISGAQYAFISKRVLVDDEKVPVEMPPIGEPGSCLMGTAFYINDGHGSEKHISNLKYHAYTCPCAYMKHNKVFIIPERLNEFLPVISNPIPVPVEAYLGVPLFADGKCFAHFGVMWSIEGAANRTLGWAYLEVLFHALEDMILQRVLEGESFGAGVATGIKREQVVPHEAITVAQSLKPYARSLSHELRTPMQGVVGMLDVMYATVQEAAEGQMDLQVCRVFETLKENIETVQDSARRAVEAADNVVHAYDMNMGVPESPTHQLDGDEEVAPNGCRPKEHHPEIVVTGNNIPFSIRGSKRRRESKQWDSGNVPKHRATETLWSSRSQDSILLDSVNGHSSSNSRGLVNHIDSFIRSTDPAISNRALSPTFKSEQTVTPGLRHTSLRDVLQYVVNDALRVGGRPESAVAQETEGGETIEVRMRSSSGQENIKTVEWSVHSDVPDTILIDEKDLAKMISCIVLNALKFTEKGSISLTARLSPKCRYVVINVVDTGVGIPVEFQPNLFKPFSREDDSLTRQNEGLGLGLLVARGLARKLGGDLFCIRSDVSGPRRGSEFEMRIPVTPGDFCSRPGTPYGSPTPSATSGVSPETEIPLLDVAGITPSAEALRDALIASGSKNNATTSHSTQSPHLNVPAPARSSPRARRNSALVRRESRKPEIDRNLAKKHPLNFLVVEDNKINRRLLVSMLHKFGYSDIHEAYDGADAVRKMAKCRAEGEEIDVVLMDLWMPFMDGYEAAERILKMEKDRGGGHTQRPTILAVTADVTSGALERAAKVGMKGFITKPYKLRDLERLIVEYCARHDGLEVRV